MLDAIAAEVDGFGTRPEVDSRTTRCTRKTIRDVFHARCRHRQQAERFHILLCLLIKIEEADDTALRIGCKCFKELLERCFMPICRVILCQKDRVVAPDHLFVSDGLRQRLEGSHEL